MPFFGELLLAQGFKERAKPLVMRAHLAVPIEHFIEEIIVIVFSQHPSKSHVLGDLPSTEAIKPVSGGKGKIKKRLLNDPGGRGVTA
jgi:hypothetical protein